MDLKPTPFLIDLREAFLARGKDIRFVGGCVRDTLAGKPIKDIDLCTDADPNEQCAIYRKAGVRFIATGLQHGTLTVVDGHDTYEITSLRIDTNCDGRHADVVYTSDWIADAARRDLTINAMSLDFDGHLHDPFSGAVDLASGRVRFVGEASERICEDYLRILRFFRFLARFGTDSLLAEPRVLATIALLAHGLKRISVERVWSEVSRILVGPNARGILELMLQTGVSDAIGFQGSPRSIDSQNPITQLVAYHARPCELTLTWKMSLDEQKLAAYLAERQHGAVDYRREAAIGRVPMDRLRELAALRGEPEAFDELSRWEVPVFPITGHDLISLGFKPGKAMGQTLNELRQHWELALFAASKDELLATLGDRV